MIACRTKAQHAGRFVNSVEVDQSVYANSVVDVGESGECESTSCGLWSPPNWDFEYVDYYVANVACGEWDSEEWLS